MAFDQLAQFANARARSITFKSRTPQRRVPRFARRPGMRRPPAGTVVFPAAEWRLGSSFVQLLRESYETSVAPQIFESPRHFRPSAIGGETAKSAWRAPRAAGSSAGLSFGRRGVNKMGDRRNDDLLALPGEDGADRPGGFRLLLLPGGLLYELEGQLRIHPEECTRPHGVRGGMPGRCTPSTPRTTVPPEFQADIEFNAVEARRVQESGQGAIETKDPLPTTAQREKQGGVLNLSASPATSRPSVTASANSHNPAAGRGGQQKCFEGEGGMAKLFSFAMDDVPRTGA